MKRLKLFFSILLLIMALPIWRFVDMASWVDIDKIYHVTVLFIWSTLFILLPIALVYRRFLIPGLAFNLCFAVIVLIFFPVFSTHSLDTPESRHCPIISYSGFFYPFKSILPAAHEDDILIRNQICWLRKLSKSIPENLNKHEMIIYKDLIEQKLFLPEVKWKSSLPFLLPIYLKFAESGVNALEAQKFWNGHFTAEVKDRDYNFLSYPHSDYIKLEYGLVEKYWGGFLDEVEIEKTVLIEEEK